MWISGLTPQDLVAMFGVSVIALALSLLTIGHFSRRAAVEPVQAPKADTAFLFKDGALLDGTDMARQLLGATEPQGSDLARLTRALARQFPELPDALGQLVDPAETELTSVDGKERVTLRLGEGQLWLRLEPSGAASESDTTDRHVIQALQDAAEMHRGLTNGIGCPMWRQTKDGQITWANAQYRELEARLSGPGPDDQPSNGRPVDALAQTAGAQKHIFADQVDLGGDPKRVQRGKAQLPDEAEPRWYEFQVTVRGNDQLITALPVDRVVQAERSLSGFVQTLTQTFAHLNVGLAIFNRSRELVIFNPALTELLDLSPEFLVTRPTLMQVFDRMREQRMVPEPKNIKSWRNRLSALEEAATEEALSETWSLVDGRTLRVTGRPHPERAIAFLFEDISSEITLERGFRSELQMGHAVIDGLSEAIAVFTPAGAMVLANRAYRELWYNLEERGETSKSFIDATRAWQRLARPTPVWGDARDFAATIGERENWTAEVLLQDGRALHCRFEALSGGYTLAGFSEVADHRVEAASQARLMA